MSFLFNILKKENYYEINNENLEKLKKIKLSYIIDNRKKVDLSKVIEKKNVVFVNVASKCGFSNQYNQLEELQKKYKKNLVIIGIPSGNFLNQEFKTEKETYNFIKKKYKCSFFLTKIMNVKGKNICELYKVLKDITEKNVTWNFNKIIITKDLKLYKFGATINPLSNKIISILNA